MGGNLLCQCVQPETFNADLPHKLVFAATDARQQEFSQGLRSTWLTRRDVQFLCLASGRDRALRVSKKYHKHSTSEFANGRGSRAGCCKKSLCCDPDAFATLDCTAVHSSRVVHHNYTFKSAAVYQCLQSFFLGTAVSDMPMHALPCAHCQDCFACSVGHGPAGQNYIAAILA